MGSRKMIEVEDGLRPLRSCEASALQQAGVWARPGWSMRLMQLLPNMCSHEVQAVLMGMGFTALSMAEAAGISPVRLKLFERGCGRLSPPELAAVNAQLDVRAETREARKKRRPELVLLGQSLRARRRQAGLSYEAVAAQAALVPGDVSRCERGLAPAAEANAVAAALAALARVD